MSETTPTTSTPTDEIDDALEAAAEEAEYLSDLPPLVPAHRFRIGQRHSFDNLLLEAKKSGAFDRDEMEFDLDKPEDIEDFQKLTAFIASIDVWAESIAINRDAYIEWSQGKREDHFLALFKKYKRELGESRGSVS